MKKNIFLALLSIAAATAAAGQAGSSGESIAIAVAVPRQSDHLNASQLARLGQKMVDIVAQSGIAAASGGSEIIMYPELFVEREELVEGGMENLVVVTADISFTIRHMESGKILASASKRAKGAGVNRQKALSDLISKISAGDEALRTLVADGRTKTADYYADNCRNIALKATSHAKRHEYRQAIAMLAAIPEAVSCYAHAQRKLEDIFADYQAYRCEELLREARSLSAGRFYMKALATLASIDNFSAQCSRSVEAMIADIEGKLSEKERQEWSLLLRQYEDSQKMYLLEANVKKARLSAIRDIATAYYSQKTSLSYNLIVK
ncbi:MAG: hypothetical protein LBG47_09120 [Prevotellaceae bacterium]|nr:hypothetical protein [Prevotellaceae bacterium]